MSTHLISPREAASRVGVTTQAIYNAINAGRLTAIGDGRPKLLDAAEVDQAFGPSSDLDKHIRALVKSAPRLSSEQAERLRALLRAV